MSLHPITAAPGVRPEEHEQRTPAEVFGIVWETLADILGTAAVAAIVRRATKRALPESPELAELVVLHEELAYRCVLPASWSRPVNPAPVALLDLANQIGRLLVDLTGTVVVRQLEQVPELMAAKLVWRAEETH
jgi:hypothetical protein